MLSICYIPPCHTLTSQVTKSYPPLSCVNMSNLSHLTCYHIIMSSCRMIWYDAGRIPRDSTHVMYYHILPMSHGIIIYSLDMSPLVKFYSPETLASTAVHVPYESLFSSNTLHRAFTIPKRAWSIEANWAKYDHQVRTFSQPGEEASHLCIKFLG